VRILGLDPGSRVCGYGVVELCTTGRGLPDLRYIECGVLTAPADRAMEDRLGEIACGLREVIAELSPTVVAVEDVFVRENPRSALALAQARGMALAVIGLAGLRVASYAPALVKKMLIGLRSLPRADASDALAVAITHGRVCGPTAVRIVASVVPAGGVP
jgi:crossover junction endodeoxyribonuclease RuvC